MFFSSLSSPKALPCKVPNRALTFTFSSILLPNHKHLVATEFSIVGLIPVPLLVSVDELCCLKFLIKRLLVFFFRFLESSISRVTLKFFESLPYFCSLKNLLLLMCLTDTAVPPDGTLIEEYKSANHS